MAKDTAFCAKRTLNCKGKLLLLDEPIVMGILNLAPDSFYDGGRYTDVDIAIHRAGEMLEEGTRIIDIGACSTRPGAEPVTEKAELHRLIPVIKGIVEQFPGVVISVDTFRAEVALRSVEAGASIINDISAGSMDGEMFALAASLPVPYVLMHMQGNPQNMQINPHYNDVIGELMDFFTEKVAALRAMGKTDIILDPGFGFGKSLEHNYRLLNALDAFRIFELPVLVGMSRKSMIWKALDSTPENALHGTVAANTIALMNGAGILRVHDVKPAVEAICIAGLTKNS